jgi:glycosyltransferase involved in cell wall biosynthesis
MPSDLLSGYSQNGCLCATECTLLGMNIYWYTKEDLLNNIVNQLKKVDVILDIGCGIIPQNFIKPKVHICCDPFKQYLELLKDNINNGKDRSYVFINASWSEVIKIFPEKSIDSIFILDVVEHLNKDEGIKLLKETEKIAREQIVIFTPLGFLPQKHPDGKDAWGLEGSKWQEHKSGWLPEDFDDSWEIHAAKEFHYENDFYIKFPKPYGAFFAIKNIKKNEELPLISIITPVFNSEKYIEEFILSILNQDYQNIEFILLDDSSSDKSLDIIKKYKKYIIYDTHKHIGEALTVNKGLYMSRGMIISIVNSDAPLYLNTVSKIVECFNSNKDAIAVYSDYNIINEKGQIIETINTYEYNYTNMIRWHHCIPGPSTFFRKEILDKLKGRDPCFKYLSDFDFWLRAGLLGKFVRVPYTLTTIRYNREAIIKNLKGIEIAYEHIKLVDKIYSLQNLPEILSFYKKEAYSSAYYYSLINCGKSNIFRKIYYILRSLIYYPKNYFKGGRYKISSLLYHLFPKDTYKFLKFICIKLRKKQNHL